MNEIENNKLIAEFMGINYAENRNSHEDSDSYYEDIELEYHTNWNWLMEVVEKIESLTFGEDNSANVTIGATLYCIIQDSNGELFEFHNGGNTKIMSVYSGVAEFIRWYNMNK